VRLNALESALARPDSRHQLEDLVLALARVATAEAESAAVRAALAARIEAKEAADRAVAELQHAIETERASARTARMELAEAQSALEHERGELARVDRDLTAERERSTALEAALRQEHESATEERDTAARFWETISTLREQLTTAQRAVEAARAEDEDTHRSAIGDAERRSAELAAQLEAAQQKIVAAEARADAAVADRDQLAAAQEGALAASEADAQNVRLLKAALERIRVLELELAERAPTPVEEVDLAALARQEPTRLEHSGERAQRFAFPARTKIRIDHEDGQLVDLSLTGAQLICKTSPEVGRIVVVTLPSDVAPCFGQGRLLWARREPTPSGRPQRYRAGLVFTDIDQAAIDAFIKNHSLA
jgi:chromosome segregation ATPase